MATPAVGQDIEALCGSCGTVWHVVMAMMGDRIAKVVCKRCGGHHRYRTRERRAEPARRAARARPAPRRPAARTRAAAPRTPAPLPTFDPNKPPRVYSAKDSYEHGRSGDAPARSARASSRARPAPGASRSRSRRARACSPAPRPSRRSRGPVAVAVPISDRPPDEMTPPATSQRSRFPRVVAARRTWRARSGAGTPGSTATRVDGARGPGRRRAGLRRRRRPEGRGARLLGRALAHRRARRSRRRRGRRGRPRRRRRRRRAHRRGARPAAGVHRSRRRPTPSAGSTARPTGCPASTSISTAASPSCAPTARARAPSTASLPARLVAAAARARG